MNEILGCLVKNSGFNVEQTQIKAWENQITVLQTLLEGFEGTIYFEFSIPRMGKRIDVLLLIDAVIFVLEFKVGEKDFTNAALDQVFDYALDLKNFHETSHFLYIAPVLIATEAKATLCEIVLTSHNDKIFFPITTNTNLLRDVIASVLLLSEGNTINKADWETGRYSPTPTIIEAAIALYKGHNVEEISRSDASAINLKETTVIISEIIETSRNNNRKSICFVTGVPGAGKTLVGLDIATTHINKDSELYSVFLSGNGPLVKILCEALARDRVVTEKTRGSRLSKGDALREVKLFIQNVHNFRDECLLYAERAPVEHVALFDEAQRAWNLTQTSNFMHQKKNKPGFNQSEPEYLISCMDRHADWAVIVCLVGGGQEINTGEAGISEWIESLTRSYKGWDIYVSPRLTDSEYGAGSVLNSLSSRENVFYKEALHLSVSMRSFRAENVSQLIKLILDLDKSAAQNILQEISPQYSIVITRDLKKAKQWLKYKARGTERYGIVVSSQAERLKPLAIDVKSPMDPVNWFLNPKDDIRSSFYLEDVATEFDVQGLELDWVCVTWDADLRCSNSGWEYKSFRGSKWTNINSEDRKKYLKNAYRVLLTRARQGMVIVVPEGDDEDQTRARSFYDPTYQYLKSIGFDEI